MNYINQYIAKLTPANFTTEKITWSSDNDTVGTIDSNGLFTAKNEGTVNITASAGGIKSEPFNVVVTIKPNTVNIKSNNPTKVNVGQSVTLSYATEPDNIEYKKVVWSIDNTTIANINKDTGVLTGNIEGTVNVTVTVNGVESAPYPVNIILPLGNVTISGPDTVMAQETATYNAVITPENSNVTNTTWSVDKENLASIDPSTGVLTAKSNVGQVNVTVDVDGNTASKLVNIIKKLEIKGNNTTAVRGQFTLSAVNNITNNLIWKSSNPAVATVENGVVTGKSAGSTDITVSENGNTSAAFTVTIVEMPAGGYEIDDSSYKNVYNIYSVAGLKECIAAIKANNASIECKLYSDLDFSTETTNITIEEKSSYYYSSNFNGNGYIIKNYTNTNGQGFIKYINKVSNVTFDNANVSYTVKPGTSDKYVAIVAAKSNSMTNVHVKNSKLTVNNYDNESYDVGIIAGYTRGTIENCTVSNSKIIVNGEIDNTGGIAGDSQGSKILGCFVDNLTISTQGIIYGSYSGGIGGIVGTGNATGCGVVNSTITNIGTNTTKNNIGGIVGYATGEVRASYFYGSISNENGINTGLDFGKFTGTSSTLYVKQKGGSVGTVKGQYTTIVDDTNVTWEQTVEKMNLALLNSGYIDFVFRYDESKGYPVIDYIK